MSKTFFIMLKTAFLPVIFCCVGLTFLQAQETSPGDGVYRPYNPVELPAGAPLWMAELNNLDTINYHRMVERFHRWQYETPGMRVKTPYNKAILNFFLRWQRAYAPYAGPDGRIRLPQQKAFVDMVDEMNAHATTGRLCTRSAAGTSEPWKVLTPIVTYNSETKQVRPWQSNVQRFDVAPSDPHILYAGTETGMVFKSTDKGQNWEACPPDHHFGGEVTSVEVSRSNADKVVVSAGALVWLTTDGGKNWKNITPTHLRTVYRRVRDVVIHPDDDNIFLLANDEGVYQTSDNGANWTILDNGQCFDLKYKIGDSKVVYSLIRKAGGVVLRKSTDGGLSFTTCPLETPTPLVSGRIGLSSAENGRDYVYVFACASDDMNIPSHPFFLGMPLLCKSRDAGGSWTVHTQIREQFEPFDRNGGQGYYDMVVQPSNTDPEKLLFGLLNLYRSTDGGETLQNVGGYYGRFDLHCDMQDLKVVGNDTWLSTDGGIIYSQDFFDTHAEARIKGIYASEFWGFGMGWNEDVMVGGRNHNGNMVRLGRYNEAAISVGGSECATGYVFLSNPRKVAFSDAGSCYLPDDWKQEFVPFHGFWTFPLESSQFGIGFEFDPRYAKSFYINRREEPQSLWKTVDDGESFVQLHTFGENVSAYAVSRSNPDVLVVGTVSRIYRSEDAGQHFTELTMLPEEMCNTANYKIAIHPRNEQEIWISTHEPGGLFRTIDGGATWEQMHHGLELSDTQEQQIVTRMILTGNDKNAVYAVGAVMRPLDDTYRVFRNRVLYRDDTTHGWQDFSEGLPPVLTITRMLPFYKEGELRLATNNGIWHRPLQDADFRPVAQPLALSAGTGENLGEAEWQFDSYSIANQTQAEWEWRFDPEPLWVSDKHIRNPKVRVAEGQSYHVTLTVTTPRGADTKTVKNMIVGVKDVPSAIPGQEVLERDVDFDRLSLPAGEAFRLLPRGMAVPLHLTLYNASGQVVRTLNLSPHGWQQLPTDGLSAGVYFFVCQSGEFKKSGRLFLR